MKRSAREEAKLATKRRKSMLHQRKMKTAELVAVSTNEILLSGEVKSFGAARYIARKAHKHWWAKR